MDNSSQNMYHFNGPIPRPNAQMLGECLRNGQLDIPTAIGQLSLFVRETLKTLEEHTDEQGKMNMERKLKADKMDKLINDLSEKCQALQQALLYKEEKYDEKCREAERYKVICELSAKSAVDDNPYYTPGKDMNNNQRSQGYEENWTEEHDRKDDIVKIERSQDMRPKHNLKSHVKLSQSQLHLVDSIEPLMSPPSCYDDHNDDNRSNISQYYAGGPTRRKIPLLDSARSPRNLDLRTRDRMEAIGGVNVKSPTVNIGPVVADRLTYRQTNSVDVTGQRNEMMSSSGNIAGHLKQKTVEKDLHKQVAGGCWNRLAGRRKKDWPF